MSDVRQKALTGSFLLMIIGSIGLVAYYMAVVDWRPIATTFAILAGVFGGGWVLAELLERFAGVDISSSTQRPRMYQPHTIARFVRQDDEHVTGCACQVWPDDVEIEDGRISHLAEKANDCPNQRTRR